MVCGVHRRRGSLRQERQHTDPDRDQYRRGPATASPTGVERRTYARPILEGRGQERTKQTGVDVAGQRLRTSAVRCRSNLALASRQATTSHCCTERCSRPIREISPPGRVDAWWHTLCTGPRVHSRKYLRMERFSRLSPLCGSTGQGIQKKRMHPPVVLKGANDEWALCKSLRGMEPPSWQSMHIPELSARANSQGLVPKTLHTATPVRTRGTCSTSPGPPHTLSQESRVHTRKHLHQPTRFPNL